MALARGNARPHPGLLPRGEGETLPASSENRAAELAGWMSVKWELSLAVPSPWGAGQGEGGFFRENN